MGNQRRQIYYGWYVLAAVAGINFANNATAIGVLTVFILPLSQEFGWTRMQLSAATSIGAVLGALAAPFTGRLTDRRGARVPLTLAGVLIVLAMVNLAVMQSLGWFYLAFGLARLADQGFVQVTSPPVIAKWFQRSRGRAIAVLFFITSAGGIVLPPLVQQVISAWHWRMAWVVLGGVMLVFGLFPCAFVLRRQPEDFGLNVDGEAPQTSPTQPATAAIGERVPAGDREESWRLGKALKTPVLWLLLAAVFVSGVAATGVALHLMPHLLQQGIAPAAAVGAVSLSFIASAVGTLGWGYFSDRFSASPLLAAAFILRAASLLVLLVADTVPKAYIFAILQGLAEGGKSTLLPVAAAQYYGSGHLGSIYGLLRSMQVAGFALGPLISGRSFDLTQSYNGAFRVFLLLSIVGAGLVALARPPLKVHPAR
jgi:OFA family oxalate/formate antiporter-like MFS transporter